MLDIPKNGWSCIHIGNWTVRCECDDDVPFALLEALTTICESNQPAAVRFQTVDGDVTFVFDFDIVHIIFHNPDGYVLSSERIPCYVIASEFVSDLRAHLDDWKQWSPSIHDPELLAERKAEIEQQCALLHQLADFYIN